MKKQYILLTCALAGGIVALQAQNPEKEDAQLDRTVVVENLYNPDIMNAHKINIMPTLEEPQTVKKQIEYAISAKPSRQFGFVPMDNVGATPEQATANKGYLRLGYGNRGNIDSRLSYRSDLSKRDVLNADLLFRGMNGTIDLPEAVDGTDEWNARTYRTYGVAITGCSIQRTVPFDHSIRANEGDRAPSIVCRIVLDTQQLYGIVAHKLNVEAFVSLLALLIREGHSRVNFLVLIDAGIVSANGNVIKGYCHLVVIVLITVLILRDHRPIDLKHNGIIVISRGRQGVIRN